MNRTAVRVAPLPLLLAAALVVMSAAPAAGTLSPPPQRLPLLFDRPAWDPDPGAGVALLPPPLRWGGLWAVPIDTDGT